MARRFIWLSAIVMALLGVPLWVMQLTGHLATNTRGTAGAAYPSAPILRIEVGQHSATPLSMSVDASGRYLVTGGLDKTIRIWALPDAAHPDPAHADLDLLDVLRPPIAEGDGGIAAVAISPDGKLVAVSVVGPSAGTATRGGFEVGLPVDERVYIFDRPSGRIVISKRVAHTATALTFSADGQYLAVALNSRPDLHDGGLRIWRTTDWSEANTDGDYGGRIAGLTFDKEGHLATASDDGQIRLYDRQLRRIARAPAPGSARPFRITFSPDGTKLVVGYVDSSAVALLDGRSLATLRLLQEPGEIATGGAESDQRLAAVAWSADGHYVFAGGAAWSGYARLVRRWDVANGGEPQDFGALGNTSTIMDLAPYGSSGVLVLSADPLIGAYDGSGKLVFARGPVEHDVRGYTDNRDNAAFRVSNDGGVVEIPGLHQPLVRFDLAQRRLSEIEQSDTTLAPPQTTSDAFEVTHWDSETHPMLQRAGEKEPHALTLEQYETSRSLAVAPKSKRFVLGTEWSLRLYSDSGKLLWQQTAPGVAWLVNITPDEKLVVAAFSDGTVRWYRIEDGKELLALFIREPYADVPQRLWIAWTPNGYYDASPGGERLIGWHINRGADKAALFYPADRFHDTFYRPDLVAQVLKTRVVPKAPPTDTIIAHLPPIVHITEVTRDTNGYALVNYEVESPSGKPVTEIRCTISGMPCPTESTKGVPSSGQHVMRVKPAPGQDKIELAGGSEDGLGVSHAALIPNATPAAGPGQGKLYALVIGVSAYKDKSVKSLRFADKDATDFAKALLAQKGKGKMYSDVILQVLTNEKATKAEIEKQLGWLTATPGSGDVSMLFISGHGVNWQRPGSGKETANYYFLPYDVDYAHDHVFNTGLSYSRIIEYISTVNGRKLVFLDTCHAGQLGEHDANGMVNALTRDGHGVVVWASSTGNQDSLEDPKWGHGAFTYAILDALYGREHSPHLQNGHFTQRQLSDWLDQRVDTLTGGRQTPSTVDLSGAKFDIATVVPQP